MWVVPQRCQRSAGAAALGGALTFGVAGGCNALWGLGELRYEPASATTGGHAGTGGSNAGATSAGGAGATAGGSGGTGAAGAGDTGGSPPGPVTLASDQAGPKRLVLRGGYVFWTNGYGGQIMRTAADGTGAPVTLVDQMDNPYGIAVDDQNVYWTNCVTQGDIRRVSHSGQGATLLVAAEDYPTSIVTAGGYLYWTTGGGKVKRSTISGTNVQVLYSGYEKTFGIAVDGQTLYWTSPTLGMVSQGTTDGVLAPIQLGTDVGYGLDIEPSGAQVLWTNYSGGQVMVAMSGEGDSGEELAKTDANPAGLAVDATHAYWAEWTGDRVMRAHLAGGAPEPIAPAEDAAYDVAVDDQYVYWTLDLAVHGAIRRREK